MRYLADRCTTDIILPDRPSDISQTPCKALDSKDNYNLLFVGPPASSKTLFLQGILEIKKGVYFDGTNTTNRIFDVLEEERLKIICIDEIDKMS